jgi:hypothetical protein
MFKPAWSVRHFFFSLAVKHIRYLGGDRLGGPSTSKQLHRGILFAGGLDQPMSQWMLGKLLSFRGIMQPLECNPAAKVKQMDASTADNGMVHQSAC